MNYYTVLDEFLKDPSLGDLTEMSLATVEGSAESTAALEIISAYREEGWRLTGDREFKNVKISPVRILEGTNSAEVQYCQIGRGLLIVDSRTGDSVGVQAAESVVETVRLEVEVDGVWRVASVQNQVTRCS